MYRIFSSSRAAIDLASIMVGVIIIGIIGGVISATIFAVIPWAQDKTAKQQLDSIVQAESAHAGLSTDSGNYRFADSKELDTAGLLTANPQYCVVKSSDSKTYQAFSKSATGKIFTVTTKEPKPVETQSSTTCLTTEENSEPITEPVDPNLSSFTFNCPAGITLAQVPVRFFDGTATWNDGTVSTPVGSSNRLPAKEVIPGVDYTVVLDGTFTDLSNTTPEPYSTRSCLKSMDSWGENSGTIYASYAFTGATHLISVPKELPSTVTTIDGAFIGATEFNQDISTWDISKITNLNNVFQDAQSFNQDISSWDISNVTTMSALFYGASSFNQDITSWDIKDVESIGYMFAYTDNFNQDISHWDTGKVTNMFGTFMGAKAFNQDISGWNTSKVTDMTGMFQDATAFNQNLSQWNVDKVTSYEYFSIRSAIAEGNTPLFVKS